MKKFLLAFFLIVSPVVAQEAELQKDAVRAFQENDLTTAKSLFQSLLALNPKNPAAQNYLRAIARREKGGGGGSIENSLKRVVIPKVDLRETSVREAVQYIIQRVQALTDGKEVVNVVWMLPADYDARVTLSLQNIPASEALKYVADAANLKLDYDAHALKVRPLIDNTSSQPPQAPKLNKSAPAGTEASLARIVLPQVELNNVTVREAVDFVGQRVKALTNDQQSLNVVWMLPPDFEARVTLSLQDIPASEALNYIASGANLKMNYGPHALTIRPAQ